MTPLTPAFAAVVGKRQLDYAPPAKASDSDCPLCHNERRIFCLRTMTATPCRCARAYEIATQSAALLPHSNLDNKSEVRFDTLDPSGPAHVAADNYASAYRSAWEFAECPAGIFTIAGGPNTGKTALALAIGNHIIGRGRPVLKVRFGDIIRAARREATTGADPAADEHRRHPTILIDDIPPVPATNWEKEQILLLIAERDRDKQATVCVLRGWPEQADADLAGQLCRQDGMRRAHVLGDPQSTGQAEYRTVPLAMAEHMTFAAFRTRGGNDRLSIAKETARRWAAGPSGWLCLAGSTGTGKTHLAVAVATVIAKQDNSPAFYAGAADLLAELRAAANTARTYDPLEPVLKATLLVLDDYGVERNTPFADEQLTRLLGHRYDHRLPTVITTNLTPAEMTAARPRVASRILDPTVTALIHLNGPDYRSGN